MKRIALLTATALVGLGAAQASADPPDVARVTGAPKVIADGDFGTATATCDPGRSAIGGGFSVDPLVGVTLVAEQVDADGVSWRVTAQNGSGADVTVTAVAFCLSVPAPGSGPAGPAGPAGAAGAAGAQGPAGPKGDSGAGPAARVAAVATSLTRSRCLALRAEHRLPGACATRFKVRPLPKR